MRHLLALMLVPFLAVTALTSTGCAGRGKKKQVEPPAAKNYNRQLPPGEFALREVDITELPPITLSPSERVGMKQAVQRSRDYFVKPSSVKGFPVSGITREQVVASLQAFSGLLDQNLDDAALDAQIKSRFRAFISVGCDDQGTVLFTGYYTPIFDGRLSGDSEYRFPLYRRPATLVQTTSLDPAFQLRSDGSKVPFPDRASIDGTGILRGTELVWLKSEYERYLVHVQGSAKIRLPDGRLMEIGTNGSSGHDYQSIRDALVTDGAIPADQLNFFTMRQFFATNPDKVATYVNKNPRYIFFIETRGGPYGSLGAKVTPNITIATDKSIFPRGSVTFVTTTLSGVNSSYAGLRVDQDTGGAIRAPGRTDLYMGEGDENENRAGAQFAEGNLYYLIVRE